MDTTQTLDFKLAKVMIAFAWVDGTLDNAEINALKDLIFSVAELTGKEWAALEIYMDSPVEAAERDALLADLLESVHTQADKNRVLTAVERLVSSDDLVSREELAAIEALRETLRAKATGFAAALARLMPATLRRQRVRRHKTALRERELEDFLRNRVLYDFRKDPAAAEMSDATLRKVCAAAALLGKVAAIDEDFSPEEKAALADILAAEWGMTRTGGIALADIVVRRAARDLDYACVSRAFFEQTTPEERSRFIRCLFQMANAVGKTSLGEIETIRGVSLALKVPHAEFIEAKLTIPRADRNGL
ncbi:MAG: hypothetical protein GXP31_10710 [Kiritimatiellaeota bacterium]|nr:hypothetical protein [Kiritimatiellota bacterium]